MTSWKSDHAQPFGLLSGGRLITRTWFAGLFPKKIGKWMSNNNHVTTPGPVGSKDSQANRFPKAYWHPWTCKSLGQHWSAAWVPIVHSFSESVSVGTWFLIINGLSETHRLKKCGNSIFLLELGCWHKYTAIPCRTAIASCWNPSK